MSRDAELFDAIPAPIGLRAVPLPPRKVRVLDPTGNHRFFKLARFGTCDRADMRNDTVWNLYVTIGGTTYYVRPDFVKTEAGEKFEVELPSADVLTFTRPAP